MEVAFYTGGPDRFAAVTHIVLAQPGKRNDDTSALRCLRVLNRPLTPQDFGRILRTNAAICFWLFDREPAADDVEQRLSAECDADLTGSEIDPKDAVAGTPGCVAAGMVFHNKGHTGGGQQHRRSVGPPKRRPAEA